MNPADERCTDTRALLAELALGIADGEQRATALEHLGTCADCRRELEALAAIADDLLGLAPEREPPVGFEARALDRLRIRERPRSFGRRLSRLSLVGTAVGAAAATAIALVLLYSGDHRLASQYRAALDGAHGRYFQSARLLAPDGTIVGNVFGYEGSPSWVFYVLAGRYRTGSYSELIVTRSGKSVRLTPFKLVDASWGVATPVPVRDIAVVRLAPLPHGPTLEAKLPVVEP